MTLLSTAENHACVTSLIQHTLERILVCTVWQPTKLKTLQEAKYSTIITEIRSEQRIALPSIIIFNHKKEQVALITFLGVTTILIHIGSAENMAAFTVIEVSQT